MIKLFNEYLNESDRALTQDQKDWLTKCSRYKWELDPSTGLVNVFGDFNCIGQNLVDFKGVKFGKIGGNFDCGNNFITSLEDGPREVTGDFLCDQNRLTSLKGIPQKVDSLKCSENLITSLEDGPKMVRSYFDCSNNRITSLKGSPKEISWYFWCEGNELTSLEGAPEKIEGDFVCSDNKLTSLKWVPQEILFGLYCDNNQINSFEFFPYVDGDIRIDNNPVWDVLSPHWNKINSLSTKLRYWFFHLLGQADSPTNADVLKTFNAIERMEMI